VPLTSHTVSWMPPDRATMKYTTHRAAPGNEVQMTEQPLPHVLILGAGFAGIAVAQELSKQFPEGAECRLTLVDQNNFSLFTPMLTEVAGGEVDAEAIVGAVRALAPRCKFEQGRVQRIDAAAKTVTLLIGGGDSGAPQADRIMQFDHLVISLGSVINYRQISGLREHSLGAKSIDQAIAIRNRALALLERADEETDAAVRRRLLTFVVGGGGFSGVETMAALNDLVRGSVQHYRTINPSDIHTVLVHPGDRLLPELSAGLANYAQRRLEQRGVEVLLQTSITGAGPDWAEIKSKSGDDTKRLATHAFIWTGGVTPAPVIAQAGLKLGHHHGVTVDGSCAVADHPGIWALGDCAEVPHANGQGSYAPTAQNATREGAMVGHNIAASIRGEPLRTFTYQSIGEFAIVGKRAGVAQVFGLRFSGIVAWAMWRAIYLAKLPGTIKKVRVGLDWLIDAIFDRDLVALPGEASGSDG